MRTSCECSRAPRSRPSTSSAARHPGLIRLPPHWGPPPFLPSVFQLTSCATCCTCARHLARASLARAPLLDMCARATVPKVQVCTVSSHSAALLRLLHCCRPPFKPPMCQGSSARVHGPAGFCTVAPGRPTLDTTRVPYKALVVKSCHCRCRNQCLTQALAPGLQPFMDFCFCIAP